MVAPIIERIGMESMESILIIFFFFSSPVFHFSPCVASLLSRNHFYRIISTYIGLYNAITFQRVYS